MHAGINYFCQPKTAPMNILKCYLITQKRPTILIMIFLSLFVDTYDEISSLVMAFIAVLGKDIFSFGDKW